MCEFRDWRYKGPAMNYFGAASPRELVPPHILARFPYALQEGHCPVCGRYLEYRERNPGRRASRSMCREHYESLIVYSTTSICFVCGRVLPDEKVRAQDRNRREVANHVHEGECMYRWTIIHDVAVGDPEVTAVFGGHRLQAREYRPFMPRGGYYSPVDSGDLIEGEFEDAAIRKLPHQPRALPSPAELMRPQPMIPELGDSGAGMSTYKGKAVKHIPLWRNKARS
jgi:hypothetical protein